MYSLLHETDDSTTVNFSLYGKFIPGSNSGKHLVTFGSKYVRLFRANPYVMVPSDDESQDLSQCMRLECMYSFRLLSSPVSVAQANISLNPGAESLLLAFEDAKLSIVAIDNRTRSLKTISLHSYDDEFLKEGNTKNFPPPIVRVDPLSRCAAMLVYGKHLAILPFSDNQQHIKSFIIPLKQIDARLENIVDMAFLEGYYEPTLLFLYEPLQTTAGRASIRYDTMCIMGVSLNTIDRQTAVVWQIGSLPMDGYFLRPIPKPIGGAVVIGINDVIYINQAVPPCGIVLNSCYDNFTKFPLKDFKSMALTLESVCVEYMRQYSQPGKIILGTADGKLMLLSLVTDSSNAVKSLTLKELTDISTPFTVTQCAPGYLFIGSRLGDSQFLRYDITVTEQNGVSNEKKAKIVEDRIDEEDLELYGTVDEVEEEHSVVETEEHWTFTELDRLMNIGPIKCLTAGAAQDLSPIFQDRVKADPVFNLVGASGHGKDGCLSILQRTIRPDVITSSTLDGAQQLWTAGIQVEEEGNELHKYLLVSRVRSTLVLELKEEMVEPDDPPFITSEPTVAVGDMSAGDLVVQVTSSRICLVANDGQRVEHILNTNFPVITASIVDPYIGLLTQNGKLILFEITSPGGNLMLNEIDVSELNNGHGITSICLYTDYSAVMALSSRKDAFTEYTRRQNGKLQDEDDSLYGNEADDEDMLLYGSSAKEKNAHQAEYSRKRKRGGGIAVAATGGEESDAVNPETQNPETMPHFLFIARETGKVTIHSLPELAVAYQMRKFSGMNGIYFDATEEEDEKDRKEERRAREGEAQEHNEAVRQEERIVEIQVFGMGCSRLPVLFAIVDDLLITYEIYSHPNIQPEHLEIAFKRLPLTVCLRSTSYMGQDGRRHEVEIGQDSINHRRIIHSFERVGKLINGIFVAGNYPSLILRGTWGGLQCHPLTLDGPIRSFTIINNQLIRNGFLYLTENTKELRICKLPKEFNYEMPFPSRKVPIEASVHFVRYLMQNQIYAVVTSVQKKTNKIWVVVNDDKQEETHQKPSDFVLPTVHQFSLNLFSAENWEKVPGTGIDLQELEHVTACEEVSLRSEATMSGLQTYLALGTINNYGEEHLVRGRIILAEVIEVVPDESQPTSKHKIKVLYEVEQKSPVTAICSLNGFLLTGMGQKLFIWGFKDDELQGISFLDMHYYVHSLRSLRNMALACDLQASLSLVRFQEQFKALSVASRDDRIGIMPPMEAQYLIDNNHTAFIMSDEGGNILMFSYSPEVKESVGGERLILRGGINIGTNVNVLIRVKGHTSLSKLTTNDVKFLAQQQTTLWSSLDGSFGYVRAISEKSFRRLSFLLQVMTSGVSHLAGLNPKGVRSVHPQVPIINAANHKNMVDGDVVYDFMHLSTTEKQDMARRLGASRYHIMDDLVQIQRLATFY